MRLPLRLSCRNFLLLPLVLLVALVTGCAGPAANYAPSVDNVETLKKAANIPLKVGTVNVAPGLVGAAAVSLRGSTMVSPVGAHFGDYVAAAVKQELELAKLYNPASATEISGTLLKNNIDAGGISTNAGQIEARFVVTNGGQVRFDKIKAIEHSWESSFAGGVAIPLARNNYPVMVQKLVGSLLGDPDFVKAIRN
ncbi:MAG: hypothetical protein V4542_08980 [Pseudomonadota bacterium]